MGVKANVKRSVTVAFAVICLGTLAGCATFGGGAENPLVGTWELASDWGQGEANQILVVNSDLTGTLEDPKDGWTSALSNVTSEGSSVSFNYQYGGSGGFEISFEGTIAGAGLDGEFTASGKRAEVFGVRN
jgi:hypothetical protein